MRHSIRKVRSSSMVHLRMPASARRWDVSSKPSSPQRQLSCASDCRVGRMWCRSHSTLNEECFKETSSPLFRSSLACKLFRSHDVANSGVVVGNGDSSVLMSKFEYADDAALIDGNTTLASARVTALAEGSLKDAAMIISVRKSKAMHIHRTRRVDATTEEDVAALSLEHKCESCGREFTKQRGLNIHMARWCDGGRTQRSRRGTLTDTAVKTAKRRAAEATLDKVNIGDDVLDNVLTFEYLGSRLQCDGDDQVDVRHRMGIAQTAFGSLSHLWNDHSLSRETKLRLYKLSVCSTLTHCCTAWALTRKMTRMINGFNSRCLHVITAWARLPWHGHHAGVRSCVGRAATTYALPRPRATYRIVRRALVALVKGGTCYPEGSLFDDCGVASLRELVDTAKDRSAWRAKVASLTRQQ